MLGAPMIRSLQLIGAADSVGLEADMMRGCAVWRKREREGREAVAG